MMVNVYWTPVDGAEQFEKTCELSEIELTDFVASRAVAYLHNCGRFYYVPLGWTGVYLITKLDD